MSKPLRIALRMVRAAKGVFSWWMVSWILIISIALLLIQLVNSQGEGLISTWWNSRISAFWRTGFLALPIWILLVWIIRQTEWGLLRYLLHHLNEAQKEIFRQFIDRKQSTDIPLPYLSSSVQELEQIGIIYRPTGVTFPKSDLHPERHAYYSIQLEVFGYLSKHTSLINEEAS